MRDNSKSAWEAKVTVNEIQFKSVRDAKVTIE